MKLLKAFVAWLVMNAMFSALMGWAGYHAGIYANGVNNYGMDAFWILSRGTALIVTVLTVAGIIVIALIEWVTSD